MTKFCGDAVGVRTGRKRTTFTGKELRKDMDRFLETGVHPHVERMQQEAAAGTRGDVLYPLPEMDPSRPFVFMDITVDNKPAGRLVVELFEDVAPAAARHLLSRCLPGSAASVSGAPFYKLLPGYALYCGKSAKAAFPGGQQVPGNPRLQTNVAGAVSVSRDGTDFAISLGKALKLDDTHQVVGRVNKGLDVLQLLGDVPVGPDDSPLMRIKLAKCGATNAQGTHENLDESLAKETAEEAAARLKQQSADTRSAVMEALQEGMGHKRTAAEAGIGPGSSAAAAAAPAAAASGEPGTSAAAAAGGQPGAGKPAGAAAAAAAAKGAAAPNKRSKLLDSLLDDLDEDDSGSSSSSEDEG